MNDEILYNQIYDRTKNFGRNNFVKEIMRLERQNKELKEELNNLVDELLNGSYQDKLGEYTRIYPVNNCCKERLKVIKKKVR